MSLFKEKKILVAGGSGFIGHHLVKKLIALNANVFSLGVQSKNFYQSGTLTFLQADMTDINALHQVLSGYQFDYVFNLSGYIDHANYCYSGRKMIDAHFIGALNLIDQVSWSGLKKFIQVGSSDEYGNQPSPQFENLRELPISPYSFAKTASTQFIQMLSRTENFPAAILRLFLVYGPGQNNNRFLPQLIKSCLLDQPFPTSEGMQIRDFCYIDDIVDAMLLAAIKTQATGKILNIASGMPITIRDVIQKVVSSIGKGQPQYGAIPYRKGENMSLFADISQAKNTLEWEPKISLQQGLQKTIAAYTKQLEG